MKIMRSTVLIVLFSSFVCYGFEGSLIDEDSSIIKEGVKKITDSHTDPSLEEEIFNDKKKDEGSWVKDAGLGLGKSALGLMCAYIAVSTSLQTYADEKNMILDDWGTCVKHLEKRDIIGFVFKDINQSFEPKPALHDLFGNLCCLSMSGYGAYKVGISAYHSFKEAYKKINRSAIDRMGKLSLGVISACIAAGTLLQTYEEENEIMVSLKKCSSHVKKDGILQTIFTKSDNFYVMRFWLNNLFSKLSLLGASTYAAYYYTAAACSSSKEAYENITTPATDSFAEEVVVSAEKKDLDLEKRN